MPGLPFGDLSLFLLVINVVLLVLFLVFKKRAKRLNGEMDALQAQSTTLLKKLKGYEERYLPLIKVDEELEKVRVALERDGTEAKGLQDRINKLKSEVSILEEEKDFQTVALYKKYFDYTTSAQYRRAIEENDRRQKDLIKSGKAAVCNKSWTVSGDLKEGARITKDLTKLALRAFNGECDAAIAKVTWSNFENMKSRIQKSFDVINDFTSRWDLSVTGDYLKVKIEELILIHELENLEHEEKEEQKALRDKVREEERVAREIEKARKDAENEERRATDALEKARLELGKATDAEHGKLQGKIAELEARLAEAQVNQQRALSMAQQTKRGNVYIISNIGSFGDGVFKIGMTRRLDPMDRVRELGDASVPFTFDVHGMIMTEDAPGLEAEIHRVFDAKRLNLVNSRKEFFRVSIDEIESVCRGKGVDVQFAKIAEAREFRESEALRSAMRRGSSVDIPASHGSELTDDDV